MPRCIVAHRHVKVCLVKLFLCIFPITYGRAVVSPEIRKFNKKHVSSTNGEYSVLVCMSIQSSNYLKSDKEDRAADLLNANEAFDCCVYCDVDMSSPKKARRGPLIPLIDKCKPTITKPKAFE